MIEVCKNVLIFSFNKKTPYLFLVNATTYSSINTNSLSLSLSVVIRVNLYFSLLFFV